MIGAVRNDTFGKKSDRKKIRVRLRLKSRTWSRYDFLGRQKILRRHLPNDDHSPHIQKLRRPRRGNPRRRLFRNPRQNHNYKAYLHGIQEGSESQARVGVPTPKNK